MWKKRLAGIGILMALCFASFSPAYAGGINAAEQSIINYYNGTVSYNGKMYQFTEAAKQQAYNKLIADDVDLTAAQAASAIRQANANLKQGIDQGYLVLVSGGETDTQTPDPGEDNNTNQNTETKEPEKPGETETGGEKPVENGNQGSGNETNGNQTGNSENDGKKDEIIDQIIENGNSGSGTGNSDNSGGFSQGQGARPAYKDTQKKNVKDLMRETLKEGEYGKVNVSVSKNDASSLEDAAVTVEQFLKGTVDVVRQNGDVVLSTGLPVKNTGYFIRGFSWMAGIGAGCFICLMIVIVVLWKGKEKNRNYFAVPVIAAAAGAAAIIAFSGDYLEGRLAKWSALWVLGAPQYAYAGETDYREMRSGEAWEPPLQGEQYGEILCDEIGLRAPLYYGDSDDILAMGAGTYAGRNVPGQGGEILVGGHDTTFFTPLQSVQKGSVITVKTRYGEFEYEVTGTKVMDVMKYKERKPKGEELSLYTCYPFGAEDELRKERFFVYAKKTSGTEIGE